MRNYTVLLAGFLAVALDVSAQVTVTDNFGTASNWTAASSFGNSSLAISGGRVNYTSSGGSGTDSGSYITWTGGTYSYSTSWEMQVDVHARAASLGSPFDYFYGSLTAYRTGHSFFQVNGSDQPIYTSMSADIIRPGESSNGFQLSYSLSGNDWFELPDNGGLGVSNGTTDGALRVTFDASTKVMTAWFDANGATGGYSWTSAASIDIDGAQNFGMTSSDTFTLALAVSSGADVFVGGDIYFDNFSVTAIPEPSTYAVWLGVAAIGGVMGRRRKARAAS